jgi:hypothetical protein
MNQDTPETLASAGLPPARRELERLLERLLEAEDKSTARAARAALAGIKNGELTLAERRQLLSAARTLIAKEVAHKNSKARGFAPSAATRKSNRHERRREAALKRRKAKS